MSEPWEDFAPQSAPWEDFKMAVTGPEVPQQSDQSSPSTDIPQLPPQYRAYQSLMKSPAEIAQRTTAQKVPTYALPLALLPGGRLAQAGYAGAMGAMTAADKTPAGQPWIGNAARAAAINAALSLGTGLAFDAGKYAITGKMPDGATFMGARPQVPGIKPGQAVPASDATKAAQYVQGLMEKEGKTPEQLAAMQATKPITAAEAIGQSGETALGALARREGETGTNLEGLLAERNAQMPSRVMDDVAASAGVHPEAARGNLDAVLAQGRAQAKPLYDAAFQRPATPMWSPRLQEFLDQPETKAGLARGLKIQRLEAITEGVPFNPSDYAIRGIESDGTPIIGWSKAETLNRGGTLAPGQTDIPNLRSMDAIKRGLDAMVEDYKNPTTGKLVLDETGKAINNFRKAFVSELDKVAPAEYGAARATAGDYLGAQEAFNFGQKALNSTSLTEKQFADKLATLSPTEIESLKGGIANDVFNKVQNDRLSLKTLMTPRAQAKLTAAFGEDGAAKFLDNIAQESQLAKSARYMMPRAGSGTAGWSAAMGEQDAVGANQARDAAINAARNVAKGHSLTSTVVNTAGNYAGKAMDALRTGGLSPQARDLAGQMLMADPQTFAKYLATLKSIPPANGALDPSVIARLLAGQGGMFRNVPVAGINAAMQPAFPQPGYNPPY